MDLKQNRFNACREKAKTSIIVHQFTMADVCDVLVVLAEAVVVLDTFADGSPLHILSEETITKKRKAQSAKKAS